MPVPVVDSANAAVILIDVQPFFLGVMDAEEEPVLVRLEQLLGLAQGFGLPCVATFEHPVDHNGWLPDQLERVFPPNGQRFVKRTFNLCLEPEIIEGVQRLGVRQLIVAGAETDVCVLHSVLGLLDQGFQVFLVEDCLFTAEANTGPALRRMEQAGAVPTTYKTLHYELKRTVATPPLHHEWNERFGNGHTPFISPYDLPQVRGEINVRSSVR